MHVDEDEVIFEFPGSHEEPPAEEEEPPPFENTSGDKAPPFENNSDEARLPLNPLPPIQEDVVDDELPDLSGEEMKQCAKEGQRDIVVAGVWVGGIDGSTVSGFCRFNIHVLASGGGRVAPVSVGGLDYVTRLVISIFYATFPR